MNIINFIRMKVKEEGSQSAVARKCGISQALVNKMMYDEYDVKLETIRKVSTAYNEPLSTFIEGMGQAIIFPAVHEGDTLYASPLEVRMIPLLSSANAGPGSNIYWENAYPRGAEDLIECPPDLVDTEAYALRVVGDSMVPKYTEGMIVYVSPEQNTINGDYVIARLKSGDTLIKRLRTNNGTIILESINQTYDPIIIPRDQIEFISKITHSREK